MKKSLVMLALSSLLGFAAVSTVQAGEVPPANAQPLSKILQAAAGQNLGSVSEAEFEHGLWEVKVCKRVTCEKLYMDPATGKVLRKKPADRDDVPPKESESIAQIVSTVESRAPGRVTGVEYEHGRWSIGLSVDPTAH